MPLVMDDVKVATHEKEWKCTNTLACLNLGMASSGLEWPGVGWGGVGVALGDFMVYRSKLGLMDLSRIHQKYPMSRKLLRQHSF